jgi:hypothetical protein
VIIGNAGESVLAPPVGTRTSLIMTEIIPSVAVFAVIFADGTPLSFALDTVPIFSKQYLRVLPVTVGFLASYNTSLGRDWILGLEARLGARPSAAHGNERYT